ncbi:hypothetical protein Lal_00044764 [Lupinus albus]|nr:hypothetical protein Lal_00044764 [Lupinus albus]
MRQFGLQQTIPQDPPNFDKLHKMDLRGKNEYNWPQKHEVWIQIWESREQCLVNGIPNIEALYHHSQYMKWYLQITRRYISPYGAYSVGVFNFATELMERTAAPQAYKNLIQTINYVHLACKELVKALADLNPMAFNISRPRAPLLNIFDMHVYDSKLQHQSSSQTQFQPQPQMSSPHLYGKQPYGTFTTYPTNYHMSQSSQFQGSLPSMFATTSNTPILAYGTQIFYHPTMSSQGNIFGNEDNEGGDDGDGDDEEEEQQLQTRDSGRDVEIPQQQLRALSTCRRRPPQCGTSSHHRRH